MFLYKREGLTEEKPREVSDWFEMTYKKSVGVIY